MKLKFLIAGLLVVPLFYGCQSHRKKGPVIREPAGAGAVTYFKIRALQPGYNSPVAVRAIIKQSDGTYVSGQWMNPSWPQVTMRGKAMAPDFALAVPIGVTEITIGKGHDYLPQTIVTNLTNPGETNIIEVTLKPLLDLYGRGWRAGDLHVHYDHGEYEVRRAPDEAFAFLAAGGNNFASFCQDHYGAGTLTRAQMFDAWKPYERSECKLWLGAEEPKNVWGHHVALLYDPWEIRSGLPYHYGMQTAHKQGGIIVPVHPDRLFPSRWYNDGSTRRYFLYPHNNYYKAYPLNALAGHLMDGWSAVSDEPHTPVLLNSYFKLLEMGYKIPLFADSDVCMDRRNNEIKAPGCFTTYFDLEGQPVSRAAISEATRKGRVMASSGPLVVFNIDTAKSGDTLVPDGTTRTIRIEANYSFNPWTLGKSNFANTTPCKLSQIDLFRNGQIIRSWSPNATNAVVSHNITERSNSWYMVRVLGNEGKWMAAYANPIYFDATERPRQPKTFHSVIQGHLYDAVSGQHVTGMVSNVRYGITNWTIPTDEQGHFKASVPIDSQLIAYDSAGREFAQDFLKQESVYAFSTYLADNYATNRASSIEAFKGVVSNMTWEFPMGLQMAASYVRTNLAGEGVMTNFSIISAPPFTPGKTNTELVMVLLDKTQVRHGDTVNWAVIFRQPFNQMPTEEISIEFKGFNPNSPKMYGKYGTSFYFHNTRSGHTSLGNGFYMRQGSMVVPNWLANPTPTIGGLRMFATIRSGRVMEDLNLMIPIGQTMRRQLLVSTPWDGLPASWLEVGIGPCNFHRTANFEVRYSDYRKLQVGLQLNGQSIQISPEMDTAHVADADDAVFYETLYYDGQCEPQYRNLANRDPIRPQPPAMDFSGVPLQSPPDTNAPIVVAIEPMSDQVVSAGLIPFYFLVDDLGISSSAGANLWINGNLVAERVTKSPIVVNLAPGAYEWQMEGFDEAGNRGLSNVKRLVVADRVAPSVARIGTQFSVSWPANVSGLSLQSTTNLGGPWRQVNTLGVVTNGVQRVIIEPGGEKVFFRLADE